MKEKEMVTERVSDLGAGAYLMMHGYRPISKEGGSTIIFLLEKDNLEEFRNLILDYLSSEFHRFDSCLMALKKMNF